MRAIFIRHGESTGNAGVPCHDLATIELTERGRGQAQHVAAQPVTDEELQRPDAAQEDDQREQGDASLERAPLREGHGHDALYCR